MTVPNGRYKKLGWTLAIVTLIFSGGVGATVMQELRLRWRMIEHMEKSEPTLSRLENQTKLIVLQQEENNRQIRIITRNQCILLQIQARTQRVLFPEECDPYIGNKP